METKTVLENPVLQRALPKWPQMRVSGQSVTVEQAKEIIRRTDSFFSYPGGNDRRYVDNVWRELGMPMDDWDELDKWRRAWGYIETEYVRNDWVSSSFIYGPHGWCAPDGRIYFADNVGKWPDSESVQKDWVDIAAAFPFLNLDAVLMSGECCEKNLRPICGFHVANGVVEAFDPLEREIDWKPQEHPDFIPSFGDESREHGIPWDWITDWGKNKATI